LALGAKPASVQMGVLSRTISLALVGVAVGVVASFAASRVIASLLFKTEPTDPTTFVGVLMLLLTVAVLAGLRASASRHTHRSNCRLAARMKQKIVGNLSS
jgi:ABC-type antimicrobial peptide transport system permease subunit